MRSECQKQSEKRDKFENQGDEVERQAALQIDSSRALLRTELLEAYALGERDFHDMDLNGIDLSDAILDACEFSGSSFVGAKLLGSSLKNCKFIKADLSNATLARADLSYSDLSWAKLSAADLVGAKLIGVTARAAQFNSALLIRAKLNDADCLGANFSAANAMAAQFESANLECADLSASVLTNTKLKGINGAWANFSQARLNWASLNWAQLEAGDFERSNLTGTNLRAANLSFANLKEATLTGADLYFCNLTGAVVPKGQINLASCSSARISYQTYTRSQWQIEDLERWQGAGATILDLEAFPREAQSNLKNNDCNLRITFSTGYGHEAQVALEALILHLFGSKEGIRILSVANQTQKSQVAFYFEDSQKIDALSTAIRNQSWREDPQALIDCYVQSELSNAKEKLYDIINVLERLAQKLSQIQSLIPISDEDQVRVLHSKFNANTEHQRQKTQLSWSNISNPKASR